MYKRLLDLGIALLLISFVVFCGCTNSPSPSVDFKNKFIGTWLKQDMSRNLTFFSNGTVPNYTPGVIGYWTINNENLIISISINQITFDIVYGFSFSNDDKTLKLTLIQPMGVGYDDTAGVYTKL